PWFPSSAWERKAPKLCFVGRRTWEETTSLARDIVPRSRASRRCVPKLCLGTRGQDPRLSGSPIRSGLFRSDVGALLGHRALHEQHQNDEYHPQGGAQPEDVEVGQRRGLLLAEVGEHLYGPQLRPGRVPRLLKEEGLALFQEGVDLRVERVEEFAHARGVE